MPASPVAVVVVAVVFSAAAATSLPAVPVAALGFRLVFFLCVGRDEAARWAGGDPSLEDGAESCNI
jgi:hypothetical protein